MGRGALRATVLGAFVLLNTGNQSLGVRVNDALASGEDVFQRTPSPDGARVFYVASPAGGGGHIFSVPSDGSQGALALTDLLPPGRHLSNLQLSPDGQRLAFTADADTPGQVELYSVLTDGSQPPVKLNGAMIAAGDVLYLRFVADGSRIVYMADAIQDNYQFHFSVPADGSLAPVQLGSVPIIGLFVLSPDGATLVYRSTQLYSVPVDGSAPPVQLSTYPGDDFTVSDQRMSPDGLRVVYRAVSFEVEDGIDWIFSVTIDGSSIPGARAGTCTRAGSSASRARRAGPGRGRGRGRVARGLSPADSVRHARCMTPADESSVRESDDTSR